MTKWNNLKILGRGFLLASLLVFAAPAFAAPSCGNIFAYNFSFTNPPTGVFKKIKSTKDFEKMKPQIEQLAESLIVANREMPPSDNGWWIKQQMKAVKANENDVEVSLVELLPRTNYVLAEVRINGSSFHIRTNGEFAFLSSTWIFRSSKSVNNYKAVGFVNGEIQTFKQTDLILSTLPETVVLSRNMEEGERLGWIENGKFTSALYGDKVHFGPNHFLFKETEPYRVQLTKKDLLAFHRLGLLEINTYDPVNMDHNLMQLTQLGLEIEYVFVGEKAVNMLRPRIKDQLRQQVLKYD